MRATPPQRGMDGGCEGQPPPSADGTPFVREGGMALPSRGMGGVAPSYYSRASANTSDNSGSSRTILRLNAANSLLRDISE